MKAGSKRFYYHLKGAILHSWINVLLIFVPLGIAVKLANLNASIVFSLNAVAIIPLAGLLAHATEAVAARLGDTLGALLNVSFGNAVELILFIILLAGNQIRVVQAALLGSILANLLLILGMAFLLGGLRYQEQVRCASYLRFWTAHAGYLSLRAYPVAIQMSHVERGVSQLANTILVLLR
jgi:Ca2+:H+ antiporter